VKCRSKQKLQMPGDDAKLNNGCAEWKREQTSHKVRPYEHALENFDRLEQWQAVIKGNLIVLAQ